MLAAGGRSYFEDDYLTVCELYDPATGRWSATGELANSRENHTATRLADNRVLVVGGEGEESLPPDFESRQVLVSVAEIFDPDTGLWSGTGDLNTARSEHTATPLEGGQVLITSGLGAPQLTTSAEIYDPGTGRWTYTGGLNVGRRYFNTVRLADGRVATIGGTNAFASLLRASAEVYDPHTGRWDEIPGLNPGRGFHQSVLLNDGQVLVSGGFGISTGLADSQLLDYIQLIYPQLALGGGFEVLLLITNRSTQSWFGEVVLDGGSWPTDRPWSVSGIDFTGSSRFQINTGLAVRGAEAPLFFTLTDLNGLFLEGAILSFDGAQFFDQIFTVVPENFVGSVEVFSSSPFFITVLRQELIPGERLRFQLTSVPATPAR